MVDASNTVFAGAANNTVSALIAAGTVKSYSFASGAPLLSDHNCARTVARSPASKAPPNTEKAMPTLSRLYPSALAPVVNPCEYNAPDKLPFDANV